MAAFTSKAAGNWSATGQTTWNEVGVPGNGDTVSLGHAVTVDVDTIVGTSPSDTTTLVITASAGGRVVFAAGKTLTVRGNARFVGNGAGITGAPNAAWEWDASQAGTPATCYLGTMGNAFSDVVTLTGGGTSASDRFEIRSNASGGCGRFEEGSGEFHSTLTWAKLLRIGDTTNRGTFWRPEGVRNVVFDTCGLVDMQTLDAFEYTNCTWKNTNAQSNSGINNPAKIRVSNTAGGASGKIVSGCVFDKAPLVSGNSTRYDDCIFYEGIDCSGPNGAGNWDRMLRCLLRGTTNGGASLYGALTDCYLVLDNAPAALDTGTATAGGTNTLTDSSKSWTASQWADDGTAAHGFFVQLTSGTGAGQIRKITGNTSTQLTEFPTWDTQPDATTTYSIHLGLSNSHFALVNTGTFSGNILELYGTNEDGDGFLIFNVAGPFTIRNNIVLPNAGKGNSCCLLTVGNTSGVTFEHNTVYTGGQSGIAFDEAASTEAGDIASVKSNIAWYGFTAPSEGGLGAYLICTTAHASNPSAGTADVVAGTNCTNNVMHNQTTSDFGDVGFNFNRTVAPAFPTNQVANPQFVDPWRNGATFAVSLGATGTTLQKQAKLFDYLKAINEPADTDYRAGATMTGLLAYIRGGFAPTNVALRAAGHDGVTIGAVEGVFGGGGATNNSLMLMGVG